MRLREVADADLDSLFAYQADPAAHLMADLPPRDREAFDEHWARIRSDPDVIIRAIEVDGEVAGHVLSWTREHERMAGYWLGRAWWGRGLASAALAEFLRIDTHRPLRAELAKDNAGSRRVLEKNGFRRFREDSDGYAYELT